MAHQKIKKNPADNVAPKNVVSDPIARLIKHAREGIIALNLKGKIIAINDQAASLLGSTPTKLLNHYPWSALKQSTFVQKRRIVQSRRCFRLAKQGMAQQFTWLENKLEKPILAYNILLSKADIEGTTVIFARISDILHEKITDWVLWSLAKIGNHHEITGVIDEVLQLVSEVFTADYASVSLIDGQQIAHTVSYYEAANKVDNVSYSLAHSPCENVQRDKSICFYNDVPNEFPKDVLLQTMHIKSYLGGPITNTEAQVVGLMSIFSRDTIPINSLNNNLFRLFLGRINLEIERLLNQRKLQFLASIPQQDPNPVIRILPTGDVIFANTQGKVVLKYWLNLYSALPNNILSEAHRAQTTNQVVRIEMEADNKIYLFSLIWIPDFNQINIYGTDISQLKNTEQNMLNLARFDALTNVANRQYFEEILLDKIHEHHSEGTELSLLLIDLDDFKIINDTLGHPIGDLLLKAATKRMVRCLRKEDFIARLGGDEFIVILNKSNTNSAIMVAEKMISVLARSFQFGEYRMKITASIGIALYPKDGITISDLLKHSDLAMYQAKKEGKNNFAVFSKSLHFIQDRRNEVIRKELKQAASRNELYVDYQPIFDLSTNEIIGLEALLRWIHPDQGLILPNEFLTIAEQTGSIHLISQWLIEQSLQDFATIHGLNSTTRLSINVSLIQLNDARFLDTFCDNLRQYGIDKDRIILDISERIITPHFQQVAKTLQKIHELDLKLCLDNFGSPQVSLPKLLALPIDFLKLDKNLLQDTEKSSKHRMLLKGIINLAKDLNLQVIQKGIETDQQHRLVKLLECPYAQGFYYCMPLQIKELQNFLKNYS